MLKAEGFTKLKCTLPHQISRSDKGKEVIMFVVTFPTMINMCTKFHSNLRRCSVKMASPLGDLCWNDSKVRGRDTMSLGNRCGFYSRHDVYRTSDLSCKGSIT